MSAAFAAESPWIRRAARPGATIRLFCFPYAGVGASAFRDWPERLPDTVEVVAVQLPGREDRTKEQLPADVPTLARRCALALLPYTTMPFALYGHCAGGLVAYEVAQELRARGARSPELLLAAAHPAPHRQRNREPVHELPDDKFVEALRGMGGAPEAVLANDDFLDFLLPVMRADFALFENYRDSGRPPLDCPITTVCGDSDAIIGLDECDGWAEHTTGQFGRITVEGGHYFVHDLTPASAEALAGALLTSPAPTR
uniref:BarC n=1 Tax=uncultured bacterium esnapd17 TaxID=1366598 RepID=S5TLH1_9BACT|nr:BarC [uncultured bacterium esnapd17]